MPKPKRKKPPFIGVLPGAELHRAMLKLQAREGISLSEQTRRALAEWLQARGFLAARKERS